MEDTNSLYEQFKSKLESVSGECYRAATLQAGKERVLMSLKDKGITSVALIDSSLAKGLNLVEELAGQGITVHQDRFHEVTPTVGAGISEAKWAIAESGSIVQYAVDVNERLCSSFTPVHIALVPTSVLLTDIPEALSRIHKEPQIPAFVGFITGPSRTSDIERVLTIGVHGPEQLVVIFVDEMAGEVA